MRTVGAIVEEVTVREAQRTVRGFLSRRDVAVVGDECGVDVQRLRLGLGRLEVDVLADLADRVHLAESDLARLPGDRVAVSAPAVILALLVIILVVVA